VSEQAFVPVAGRVQVPPEEKVPALELVKVTVPPGRMAVPPEASDTVAVQVVPEFTGTEDGEQVTLVELLRFWAVMEKVPLEPLWSVSPP
jgi:hypothetical protein